MSKIICISRQYASGGREIGQKIAQHYKIPFYDSWSITEGVKKAGFSEKLIHSLDEKATDSFLYSIAMGYFSRIGTAYDEAPGDKIFKAQASVIRGFAEKGSCVIVGRCAESILQNVEGCHRIFIYAKKDFREKRAIKEYGEPAQNIGAVLKKKDRERAAYHTRYSDTGWGTLENFDLAVDSSSCGIEGSVNTIIAYLNSFKR